MSTKPKKKITRFDHFKRIRYPVLVQSTKLNIYHPITLCNILRQTPPFEKKSSLSQSRESEIFNAKGINSLRSSISLCYFHIFNHRHIVILCCSQIELDYPAYGS